MADDKALGVGRTCFIIGPIGDRLEPPGTAGKLRFEDATQMWENVFEPACLQFSLEPVRADKIAESGEIPEQIFTYLRDADVVIADLTGGNANVMYELGLRHTRDKITIQVGEHERLPFDVNTIRTVKFKRTDAGLIDARNGLVETLRAALTGNGTPVTATRVWNSVAALAASDIQTAVAQSLAPDVLDSVEEAPGSAELLAEGEDSLLAIGGVLGQVSDSFQSMTDVSERHLPGITNAASFSARLPLLRAFAEDLAAPASQMDTAANDYLQNVESVDMMISILAEQIEESEFTGTEADDYAEFLDGLTGLTETVVVASENFTETLGVVRDMRRWSKLLKPVSKSLEHSLNRILRGNALVVEWRAKFEKDNDSVA